MARTIYRNCPLKPTAEERHRTANGHTFPKMTRSIKVYGGLALVCGLILVFIDWSLPQRYLLPTNTRWLDLLPNYKKLLSQFDEYITGKHSLDKELFHGIKYLAEEEYFEGNNTMNVTKMAHAKYSRFFIQGSKTNIRLGDKIQVRIDLYDKDGRRRLIGGDYLRLWMENVELKAYVAGEVFDHNNGSYTGFVRALWVGKGVIRVFIARRREEIALYYTLYKEYSSLWNVRAGYVKGNISEFKTCLTVPFKDTKKSFCNFTSLNWDFPWFCEKPTKPNLTCSSWQKVNSRRLSLIRLDPQQRALYEWSRNDSVDILPQNETIDILKKNGPETKVHQQSSSSCNELPPEVTWEKQQPNGFFYNDTWQSSLCTNTLNKTKDAYRECLRNKTLWLTGDSTSQQFYYNFLDILKLISEPAVNGHDPRRVTNETYNLTVKWYAHALPFYHGMTIHNRSINVAQHSILDNLPNTSEDIVVLFLYVHMVLVHPDVFRRHVQRLVLSAKDLLSRAPRVTLAVRGPHFFYRSREYGLLSYWGLIYVDIWHEEFSSIKDRVIYLDFWDMTIAKARNNVHYSNAFVKIMVHNMMSYLCHRNPR